MARLPYTMALVFYSKQLSALQMESVMTTERVLHDCHLAAYAVIRAML